MSYKPEQNAHTDYKFTCNNDVENKFYTQKVFFNMNNIKQGLKIAW